MKHTQNIDTKRAVIRNSVIREPSGGGRGTQSQALGLSPRLAETLIFIDRLDRETGCCPSFDEIAVALGCTAKSAVHRKVHSLVERGYLVKHPKGARSLKLTDAGLAWLSRHNRTRAGSPR